MHDLGLAGEKKIKESRKILQNAIKQRSGHLVFTSGGTESINLAIKGYLYAHRRLPKRILTTQGEHAATRETLQALSESGYSVQALPLTRAGIVDLESLQEALQTPAALLTLLHVNNETGAENPLSEILRLKNKLQPNLAVHLDAVQTFGKTRFSLTDYPVELLSGSGHKFGAPKGSGFLAVAAKVRLKAQMLGGGQQEGLRSGTENPPLVAALALALQQRMARQAENQRHAVRLRQLFIDGLQAHHIDFDWHAAATAVPQIISLSLPGLKAEPLVSLLGRHQVYVSAGSACSSRQKKKQNSVIRAMGLPPRQVDSTIRVSLALETTEAQIKQAVHAFAACHESLIRVHS